MKNTRKRLPNWLKKDVIDTEKTKLVRKILRESNLNTVCDSARCPNKCECYANNTATFMILGNTCTRNCMFCGINHSNPDAVNSNEPALVAEAVQELGLKYAVITSVTRDDLPDGGAGHFAETIRAIKKFNPRTKVEVLTPDFKGDTKAIDTVLEAEPDVFNHNIETVKRLYSIARPQAVYQRSLEFLKYIKSDNKSMTEHRCHCEEGAYERRSNPSSNVDRWIASSCPSGTPRNDNIKTKSGFMVGLGETREEITELLHDLKAANVDIVTIGQYIQPTKSNLVVEKYYTPEEFNELEQEALEIGIKSVFAGPLVRSSYRAGELNIL